MAITISKYAEKYTSALDEILKKEALTADLTTKGKLVGDFVGAKTVQVAKLAMDGLVDYSRADGFTKGSASIQWEALTLNHDRGQEFEVDEMDDDETARIFSAKLMSEFERTQVIPELDAYRFATYATAGTQLADKAAITDGDKALAQVIAAETAIEEAEGKIDNCILYLSPAVKNALKAKMPYRFAAHEDPDMRFETFDGMKVVTVPSGRFNTAVTLTASGKGGFTTSGTAIDLMIIDPSAVVQIEKLKKLRYFAPDTNQDADAHKWQYRLYHDAFVLENRKALIQYHTVASK